MPTKFLAPFLLLVASAAFGQDAILSELPGGLKGEIIMLAKNKNFLSIAVKITNVGLNGVLVNEGETKRTFTLQALPNAEPIDQVIYVSGDVETRAGGQQNAILSEPIRLRVKATQVSMK